MNVVAEKFYRFVTHERGLFKHRIKLYRTEQNKRRKNTKRQTKITNTVHKKGLDRCRIGTVFKIPKTNEQVRGNPNPFPAKEKLNQIICCYQHHHSKAKQAEVTHKAGFGLVVAHITNGVDMHT